MKKIIITGLFLLLFCGIVEAQMYHEEDKEGLRMLLRRPTETTGELHLHRLGLTTVDTLNWTTSEEWISKIENSNAYERFFIWNSESPQRLIKLKLSVDSLYGILDTGKFVFLEELDCSNNQLTGLDVSKNIYLQKLFCYGNQLSELDVSKNSNLNWLECFKNQLTELDVSKSINLYALNCSNNQLKKLSISDNFSLRGLLCGDNQLTELDVSKNVSLLYLNCNNNQLKELNVLKNIGLGELSCNNNQLTELDVSENIKLYKLDCKNNQLTELDVSKNIMLNSNQLFCASNKLKFSVLERIRKTRISALESLFSSYYSPQSRIEGGTVIVGQKIDLSSEYSVNGTITKYQWYTESGMPVNLEHNNAGLFIAEKEYAGENLICKMTNSSYPGSYYYSEYSPLVIEYRVVIAEGSE